MMTLFNLKCECEDLGEGGRGKGEGGRGKREVRSEKAGTGLSIISWRREAGYSAVSP